MTNLPNVIRPPDFSVLAAPPPAPAPAPPAAPPATVPALPEPVMLEGLRQAARDVPPWLWHGYLAPGRVTLLTSLWKSGKTTLLSVLLARMKAGGTLAGLSVAAGKAVVVSEEGPADWEQRSRRLDLDGQVWWLCRPFPGKPTFAQWLALIDRLAALHQEHGLALAVIDSLAHFLPGRDENNAAVMLEALAPLRRLCDRGLAVLLPHHPSKAPRAAGLAARGSGALAAFADILVEMDYFRRNDDTDRRRRLHAFSRLPQTPRRLVIELNAEGTDYAVCDDQAAADFLETWEPLRSVLADAPHRLSRANILEQWPEDWPRPSKTVLWKWLTRAVDLGLVLRRGTGLKGSSFLYWLPEQEAKWRADPGYDEELESKLEQLR